MDPIASPNRFSKRGNLVLKIALVVLLVTLSVLTLASLVRQARAEYFIFWTDTPERLTPAEAANLSAQYSRKQGDYWLNIAIPSRPDRAEAEYRKAIEWNPCESAVWLAWGQACARQSKQREADKAFSLAANVLDPNNHDIQLAVGNYYLQLGDREKAAVHHGHAIRLDASLARGLYPVYWNLDVPPLEVAEQLLNHQPALMRTYFLDYLQQAEPESAQALWQAFAAREGVFDAPAYRQYYNFLITKKAFPTAKDLWHQIARDFYKREWNEADQPLWNADLSLPLTFPGGLEWSIRSPLPPGTTASIESVKTPSPSTFLQIRFQGLENLIFYHVSHAFFVEPGATYALGFQVQSLDLTTDNGLYVKLVVHSDPPLVQRSQIFTGTGNWDAMLDFTVPASGHWAEIILCRDRSQKLNNKIKGDVRFSGFMLNRRTPSPSGSNP